MPNETKLPDASDIVSPKKLAHVVLRTSNLKAMAPFYEIFLGGQATFKNDYACFVTYDEEHHRLPKSCGLDHIAFTFQNTHDLAQAYTQRKAHGIIPLWCVNHGITMSMYYRDPDGNVIETLVDSLSDLEKQTAFMNSLEFLQNPVGVDYDPENLVKRLADGEAEESILKMPNIGPRGQDTVPLF
ncbi:Glyoxalase/Bleomycin resistance protein/Dihydroxybiphenyl dioxygenase [Trichoderma sp. SZMC 28012]